MEAAGGEVGCAHYKRKSKFVTPCCGKIYTCRFCHDENEKHAVNRKDVTELVCTNCDTRQKVQAVCEKCNLRFGKYTCLECKLFDDEEKNQYHCDGCGICRIGGRDRFFHCEKCNMCLPIKLKNRHKCVENVSRANCPVCLEDIHTSRIPCHIPDCGHLLHRTCFEELLQFGHYACPTCQTSLMDMTQLWKLLDGEVAATPMPNEYRNYKAEILCKDCHEVSVVQFHVVGLKCLKCGSYNTCRTRGTALTNVSSGDEDDGEEEVAEESEIEISSLQIEPQSSNEENPDNESWLFPTISPSDMSQPETSQQAGPHRVYNIDREESATYLRLADFEALASANISEEEPPPEQMTLASAEESDESSLSKADDQDDGDCPMLNSL